MTDLDLARQLVDYVDVTTQPVSAPPALRLIDNPYSDDADDIAVADRIDSRRTRAWVLIAVAAATLGLIVGLVVSTSLDDEPVPLDDPQPATTPAPAPESEEDAVEQLPLGGFGLEAGRYETYVLGTDATFDVPVDAVVEANFPGRIIIGDRPSLDEGSRFPLPPEARILGFARLSGWYTKTEATTADQFVAPTISPDDPDAWTAANDVIATPRQTIEVAGRETLRWDAVVDPESDIDFDYKWCLPDYNPCFLAGGIARPSATPDRGYDPLLRAGNLNRFWLITIEGSEPLLVKATAPVGDEAWLDLVETTTIATLVLGPDEPPLDG